MDIFSILFNMKVIALIDAILMSTHDVHFLK